MSKAHRSIPPLTAKDISRFWDKVDRGGPEQCWPWRSYRSSGYGRFWLLGWMPRAHRIAWVLSHGRIPNGLRVCHHCDNPPGCNPAHPFLGTDRDNVLDRVHKGRPGGGGAKGNSARGERHGRAKLTEGQVRAIRRRRNAEGVSSRKLASHYGVSRGAIYHIVSGRNWKHLLEPLHRRTRNVRVAPGFHVRIPPTISTNGRFFDCTHIVNLFHGIPSTRAAATMQSRRLK